MADDLLGMGRQAADELARAKAEQAKSEAAKARAEAGKLALEQARVKKLLEQDDMRLEEDRMRLTQARRSFAEWGAQDCFEHVYYFLDSVGDATAERCMATLDLWDRLDPGCELTIIFNSPGGEVVAGLALFDHIRWLSRKGHRIVTIAEGMAASMAGILLQAGDHRIMGKEAWVLIHETAFGTSGKMFQIEDRVAWVKRVQERILDIFAERSKEAHEKGTATKPLSKANFKTNWSRKDWWLSSEECLKHGIVDEVR